MSAKAINVENQNILAIDPGTTTGWAIGYNWDSEILHGTQKFVKEQGESDGIRFIKFRRWLEKIVRELPKYRNGGKKIDLVVYEMPLHRGGAATRLLVGMMGLLQAFCAEYGIEYAQVKVGTLKKFATGKGNSNKDVMGIKLAQHIMKHTRIEYNPSPFDQDGNFIITDDNEVDAIWILHYALEKVVGKGAIPHN